MDLFEYASQNAPEEGDPEEKGVAKIDEAIYTVGDLTSEVKGLIKARFGREHFWVKGELSNFKGRNQSGHMYFSLKDNRAVLGCVFFKNANQKIAVELKEGLEVLVCGRLDLYEPHGKYQLVVEEIRPGGLGELYLRFEQLKKKLEAEGLFAKERKKPLPEYPHRIGVVTSATGAVIRDIITVSRRRCPFVSILLAPVKVQGEGAAKEIAAAIIELNKPEHKIDVMIVGRGGGSIEDLWAFNEEEVARAIAGSKIPVISAVGHQTDFTIADFVSDMRAATPSQAAELAVPDVTELKKQAELFLKNVVRELIQKRTIALEKLVSLQRSPYLRDPKILVRDRIQRLELAIDGMISGIQTKKDRSIERTIRTREHLLLMRSQLIEKRVLRFQKSASNLDLLSPLGILSRGYSVVRGEKKKIIKSVDQLKLGDPLSIKLHEGEFDCQVKKIYEN